MAVAAFGLWLMASMSPQTQYGVVARNLVVIGLGLGSALSSFAIAAQNAVPLEHTGVATALGTFARSIGSTVTSAGLGGLLSANIGTTSATSVPPLILAGALHDTFLAAVVIVGLGALMALALKELPFRSAASSSHATSPEQSARQSLRLTASSPDVRLTGDW
jgi:hypothetical protein